QHGERGRPWPAPGNEPGGGPAPGAGVPVLVHGPGGRTGRVFDPPALRRRGGPAKPINPAGRAGAFRAGHTAGPAGALGPPGSRSASERRPGLVGGGGAGGSLLEPAPSAKSHEPVASGGYANAIPGGSGSADGSRSCHSDALPA